MKSWPRLLPRRGVRRVSDLTALGAAQAAAAIRDGKITAEELVTACLQRIADHEDRVRAFVDLQPDNALALARELDKRRPTPTEIMFGVPVAIKEVFDVRGFRCSWGTVIHADRRPDADATCVTRLRAAGAVILGTTVSTEYAIAAAGPTTNPWDPQRTPGGSSSGSAAAVACGMVPLALASQSIGSIVRPATYCGVLGLKPTRGAISTRGGMALARELDHVGFIARHAEDVQLGCRTLFAHDPLDPDSVVVRPPGAMAQVEIQSALIVSGPFQDRVGPGTREALKRAVAALSLSGLTVDTIELPAHFDDIEGCIYTLLCRGIAEQHGADYERTGEQMSSQLRKLVERGRAVSDQQHATAVTFAQRIKRELLELLPSNAVAINAATDDVAHLLTDGTGSPLLQGLWTLVGFPVLAVPCGKLDRLPVGVQLAARPGREDILIRAAGSFTTETAR